MAEVPPKIVLFIRALTVGGAERQVLALAEALCDGFEIVILTLYGDAVPEIAGGAVRHVSLAKRGRFDIVGPLWRILRFFWSYRPDLVYGFLPTQTVIGTLIRPLVPRFRLVFAVRSSLDYRRYDWAHRLVYRLETHCARHADWIVANAEAGRRMAITVRGFAPDRIAVIDNLIDCRVYAPSDVPSPYRAAWQWVPDGGVIGCVARLDPMKGIDVFLAAAALLARTHPAVRFVVVGDGPPACKAVLRAQAAALGLVAGDRPSLLWVDPTSVTDGGAMTAVYRGFDLLTLCSHEGEGFPNVVAEAMASGVPVVATDVGDCARIIGDTGCLVPPGDAVAMARAWAALLQADRRALGQRARARIETVFDRKRVVEDNRRMLLAVLAGSASV